MVVNSAFGTGGTWAGAVEALSRLKETPVFVRLDSPVSEGNQQLHNQGAKAFPSEPWNDSLKELLAKNASVEPIKTEIKTTPEESIQQVTSPSKDIIYQAVLPLILNHLQQPKDAKYLAEILDVRVSQMQDWLTRAMNEGKVRKINKPVAYVVTQQATQLSLL